MKKCAVINDISGFGKCSLTASIPILSVLGVEVHPFITSVYSNQTAYNSYASVSLTDNLSFFIDEWKKLITYFDGILTGFISDYNQIKLINNFIDNFKANNSILVVDPVMADNGSLYSGVNENLCTGIIDLCYKADIITPNTSELSIIAKNKNYNSVDDIIKTSKNLLEKGIKNIIVTGYDKENTISNIVVTKKYNEVITSKKIGNYFSGTGDIFSSIITGEVLNGKSLVESTEIATNFIRKSISITNNNDPNDGINFEKILGELI